MRPIDADKLYDELKKRSDAALRWYREETDGEREARAEQTFTTFCEVKLTLDEQPTIDAVPVVRCKDCKYRIQQQTVPFSTPDPQCIWYRIYRNPDGYCHLGKQEYSYTDKTDYPSKMDVSE